MLRLTASRIQDDDKERDTTENLLDRVDVEDILELKEKQQEDEKLKASAVQPFWLTWRRTAACRPVPMGIHAASSPTLLKGATGAAHVAAHGLRRMRAFRAGCAACPIRMSLIWTLLDWAAASVACAVLTPASPSPPPPNRLASHERSASK
jgi:hypothetical protein